MRGRRLSLLEGPESVRSDTARVSGRALLRRAWVETLWGAFAVTNLAIMFVWPDWLRLPFFLVWISLTLVYGFRLWSTATTVVVMALLSAAVVGVVLAIGVTGDELWGKLVAVPFLAGMFLVMAWHSRRRGLAERDALALAEMRGRLLDEQRRFVSDASHELRTPVTIVRGHVELARREQPGSEVLAVALDELGRMEHMIDRLLLLAASSEPGFIVARSVDFEEYLEDVFLRWCAVAERTWRLQVDLAGPVWLDPDAMRAALDALLENAVAHTEVRTPIMLRAFALGEEIVIEVEDEGSGIPAESLETVFARFARADGGRARAHGGVGLGLALVDAIITAHGGRCTVTPNDPGVTFALYFPLRELVESRGPEGVAEAAESVTGRIAASDAA